MSTFADSTRPSTLPSANADRARAALGSRHSRSAGRHVAVMLVAGDDRVGNGGDGMHGRVLHMGGRRARQRKGAPASPAPPLSHCEKYGVERVPGQDIFSLLGHFSAVSGFPSPPPSSCPDLFHCCPVKMGWTRYKALVQAGFRPFRRIGTRIAARRPPPSLSPCCHPGLDPGSRPAPDIDPGKTGRGRCLWLWTPDQVRGDNRG